MHFYRDYHVIHHMTIEQHISSQIHYPLYAKTVINTIAAKFLLAI